MAEMGLFRYGNARHPAQDSVVPDANGPTAGRNSATQPVLVCGASGQARQMATAMAVAVNTASPMSSGARVWSGDTGYGVNRLTGRLDPRFVRGLNKVGSTENAHGAIAPLASPTAVRVGAQAGASASPAYPSTGGTADYGSPLAWMSMKQVSPGMGM